MQGCGCGSVDSSKHKVLGSVSSDRCNGVRAPLSPAPECWKRLGHKFKIILSSTLSLRSA